MQVRCFVLELGVFFVCKSEELVRIAKPLFETKSAAEVQKLWKLPKLQKLR